MIRWSSTPDKAFEEIVAASFEFAIDSIAEDESLSSFGSKIREMFTPDRLLTELKRLEEAHQSDDLFGVSDYHFMLLYDILESTIEIHNDMHEGTLFGGLPIGKIDFTTVVESFFWDLDFLVQSENMAGLSADEKVQLGYSPEVFGVINNMPPHPDELRLVKQADANKEPAENRYVPGMPYPYLGPADDDEIDLD